MAILLPPTSFSAAQVLGNFLERFTTVGVILSCIQQQRVYHYGQWADTQGMDFVFSRARSFAAHTLDANIFAEAWNTPSPDVTAAFPAEPTGPAFDVSQLDDQKILLHFMKLVECRAALLTYQGDDFMSWGFWRWRAKDGEQWAKTAWKNERHGCPSWPEASLGAGQFCPTTYERVIQDASAYHRQVTAQKALLHGWSLDDIASCNALPIS
jgi:hypothetical protein